MLTRLILALMLACFALPAMATGPCHDAPMSATMQHHSTQHAPDDKAQAAHLCIGCVPPSSWRAGAPVAAIVQNGLPPWPQRARFDHGTVASPATPPPREQG